MSNSRISGGIGLGGATFIVFLVLKLVGVIDWSWLWVFSPLWIPIALVLILAVIGGVFVGVAEWLDSRKDFSEKRR